jgi:hypothetical protein
MPNVVVFHDRSEMLLDVVRRIPTHVRVVYLHDCRLVEQRLKNVCHVFRLSHQTIDSMSFFGECLNFKCAVNGEDHRHSVRHSQLLQILAGLSN